MTVRQLYEFMNGRIPASLSCEWDNDGLMCCPDGCRNVRKVLVTLDVTADAVDEAVSGGFDVIVSHHPFIFHAQKSLTDDANVPRKAMTLIRNGIAVMSFHTRLDALEGGVNDLLAERLGVTDVAPVGADNPAICRVGHLEKECTATEFAQRVKQALGAPFVLLADAGRPAYRIALLGGEGGDDIETAKAAGADTFVSGRLGYHNMTDAPDCGINLIEAGHFYTEDPVCGFIAELIREADSKIACSVFYSNRIKAV